MKLTEELTCAELVELVTEYFEGGLEATDRERFEEHLAFCDGCDVYVEQMRRTIVATGRLREEDVPAAFEERLLAVFRGWKTG